MSDRPDLDLYFMRMARLAATRSTCLRKAVGCVLVDAKGRTLATGYNGVARGRPHCNEHRDVESGWTELVRRGETVLKVDDRLIRHYPNACDGALLKGGSLDICGAVHAEQNAVLQCHDPDRIDTVYCTLSPCVPCLKLLLNTGAARLVIGEWWRDAQAAVAEHWNPRLVVFDNRQ